MKKEQDPRIDLILKNRWIGYTKSDHILKSMELLLRFPKSGRMQNLLIVGESNNGKTTIAERFLSKNPLYIATQEEPGTGHIYETVIKPVAMIQCPHIPHEKRLYYNILDELNLPYRKTTKVEYLQQQVIGGLIDMQVRVLILDEIHHILSGSGPKQREFLNLLKYLSNEAKISFVALGTNDSRFVFQGDRQLDSRFDRLVLPRWKYDKDFIRLLATIEQILPFGQKKQLTTGDVSKRLFEMSHGIIGEVVKILKLASLSAIENDSETIDVGVLEELKYVSPFDNAYDAIR